MKNNIIETGGDFESIEENNSCLSDSLLKKGLLLPLFFFVSMLPNSFSEVAFANCFSLL